MIQKGDRDDDAIFECGRGSTREDQQYAVEECPLNEREVYMTDLFNCEIITARPLRRFTDLA